MGGIASDQIDFELAATHPAVGVEYPLGVVGQYEDSANSEHLLLRATRSVDRQNGSIQFAGEIPELGSKSWTVMPLI
ncbi:MAG: hypothetical protein QNJ58_17850 [Desulfobacterales bacterium]|nr:hypothetical protein [Desulfobacterales bacterium]